MMHKYKASSSANLLAFSILLSKITALPVTSAFKIFNLDKQMIEKIAI